VAFSWPLLSWFLKLCFISKLTTDGYLLITYLQMVNVAKYHLGKVKLELMQPASVPIQLISFRQVKYELMQPAVSAFGST